MASAAALVQRHFGPPVARDEASVPAVPGADAARAFRSDRPATGDPGSLHLTGYEVVFVRGTVLVVVSVQVEAGDPSATQALAEAAAFDLAAQQAACLGADGPCGPVQAPAMFSPDSSTAVNPAA
jgi:hypothetical protein